MKIVFRTIPVKIMVTLSVNEFVVIDKNVSEKPFIGKFINKYLSNGNYVIEVTNSLHSELEVEKRVEIGENNQTFPTFSDLTDCKNVSKGWPVLVQEMGTENSTTFMIGDLGEEYKENGGFFWRRSLEKGSGMQDEDCVFPIDEKWHKLFAIDPIVAKYDDINFIRIHKKNVLPFLRENISTEYKTN